LEKSNIDSDNYSEVESIKLSDYIINLNRRVALLKIDIECHEDIVLNDLIDNNVFEKIDFSIVEIHDDKYDFMKPRIKKLKERLAHYGLTDKVDLSWH